MVTLATANTDSNFIFTQVQNNTVSFELNLDRSLIQTRKENTFSFEFHFAGFKSWSSRIPTPTIEFYTLTTIDDYLPYKGSTKTGEAKLDRDGNFYIKFSEVIFPGPSIYGGISSLQVVGSFTAEISSRGEISSWGNIENLYHDDKSSWGPTSPSPRFC